MLNANEIIDAISSENTWVYNITDPLVVRNHSNYLLKIRVKSKEKN